MAQSFDALFPEMLNASSTKTIFKANCFETPLGPMISIADEQKLYLLEFIERRALEQEINRLQRKMKAQITKGETIISKKIIAELQAYFEGKQFYFETPLHIEGSPFQQSVWGKLQDIPAGETRSYRDIAEAINRPSAYRAVARANSTNQLAIVIPCHRVINTNGALGGYAAGIDRKTWLLQHEKSKI